MAAGCRQARGPMAPLLPGTGWPVAQRLRGAGEPGGPQLPGAGGPAVPQLPGGGGALVFMTAIELSCSTSHIQYANKACAISISKSVFQCEQRRTVL